jgi:pimeloyl-ACP methyl ester carboxylesterase
MTRQADIAPSRPSCRRAAGNAGRIAAALAGLMLAAIVLCGCGGENDIVLNNAPYTTEARKSRGLVVILPGIDGPSRANQNTRAGLARSGVQAAMPIYPWGVPIPGAGLLVNQTNVLGNRMAGANLAEYIQAYQRQYPGRPVFLIGHSGGGGVAVFAAEAMPAGQKIDGLVLLSASLSADYDLSKALARLKRGIVNFYNPSDRALLGVGTTIMGNVDGGHGASAGLEGLRSGSSRVWNRRVSSYGGDPHFAATRSSFVAGSVAPWILASSWPPGYAAAEPETPREASARRAASTPANLDGFEAPGRPAASDTWQMGGEIRVGGQFGR